MTVLRSDLIPGSFDPTVQQAASVPAVDLDLPRHIVRVTNESYTVKRGDKLIILAATTSAGDYALTFPVDGSFPDGYTVHVLLPAALGGTDSYITANVQGGNFEFDADEDAATFVYLKTENRWHRLMNKIA